MPATLAIPKGLCPSAQGCEERATLGNRADSTQPHRGFGPLATPDATPLGLITRWLQPQGSSLLATLGFASESRWDSDLEFPKGINPNSHHP